MNEETARKILGDVICNDGCLSNDEGVDQCFLSWSPLPGVPRTLIVYEGGVKGIYLDGDPSLKQLQAITWWVENKGDK